MKRFVGLCGLVIGIVLVQACGGGGAPTPSPAGTAADDPADNVAAAGPIRQNTIWMSKHDGQYENEIDAPCIGTAQLGRPRVERKQRVRWHVKNSEFDPCPNLDVDQVEVRFVNAVLSLSNDGGNPAVSDVKAMGGRINARVHSSETTAPDSKQKYFIYYLGMKASPDPELDILGDCGGCGPQ